MPGRKTRRWPDSSGSSSHSWMTGTSTSGLDGRSTGRWTMSTGCDLPSARTIATIAEECGHGLGVEGGRHHHDEEVGTDLGAHLAQQGQGQVRLQATLVELVEYHGAYGFQEGVGQELARQDTLGDEAEAGGVGQSPLETDLVADLPAQGPAPLVGHAAGGGTCGHPSRLEHDDIRMPRREQPRTDDRRRKSRGLTRPRRCHDNQAADLQILEAGGYQCVDRQWNHGVRVGEGCRVSVAISPATARDRPRSSSPSLLLGVVSVDRPGDARGRRMGVHVAQGDRDQPSLLVDVEGPGGRGRIEEGRPASWADR